MNPLTLVKRIQNLNSREAALGISDEASWHAKYKDSAYIFVGGIPFDLTEGDLLAVFSQYGEIVDVNLVRDKGTGKSKGFAFVAYEDQRSTNLAVDNLNGAQILGRIIRVDHVTKYKKKEEDDDDETLQKKREERGVCRAFQRGECNREAGCKFSHDEQRAANTGWGSEDNKSSRWGHDKFGGSRSAKRSGQPNRYAELAAHEDIKADIKDVRSSRGRSDEGGRESHYERNELHDKLDGRGHEKRSEWRERKINHKEDRDRQAAKKRSAENNVENFSKEDMMDEKRLRTNDFNQNSRENRREENRSRTKDHERSPREDRREDRRSRCFESEPYHRDDREDRGDKRSTHGRYSSLHCLRGTDEDDQYSSRR